MTKRRLGFITSLMVISLTGLIIIQFIWIRNSVLFEQKQFDNTVTQVLNKVVRGTSFYNRTAIIYNYELKDDLPAENINREFRIRINNNRIDSIDKSDTLEIQNIIFDRNSTDGNATEWTIETESSHKQLIFAESDSDREFIRMFRADSLHFNVDSLLVMINRQTEKFEDAYRQMAFESIIDTLPTRVMVRHEELESLLRKEFNNSGITLSYDYAVASIQPDTTITLKSEGFSFQKAQKIYDISLFPDLAYATPSFLFVAFSDGINVLNSLSAIHITAILFSLIIILAFLTTFNSLLKQKKNSEMKTDFINNMTHEFKTPIATINLAIDSINKPASINNPEKIKQFTGIIKAENKRMDSQVDKVLQMSLLERHEMVFQPREISLHDYIQKVVNQYELIIDKRKGKINLRFEAVKDCVFADPEHLENIVSNLVDNAIKYSDGEPDIDIQTQNLSGEICLTVSDKGIGISKKDQSQIFDRFYRVSVGNTHNVKGFGLGLSYVKAVIDNMGGSINISSEPGKGSMFIICLKTY